MYFINNYVVRLVIHAFERDNFRADSVSGQRLLRGALLRIPDNKAIEDPQGDVKIAAAASSNTRLKTDHIQDILNRSKVLKQRGIRDAGEVDQAQFKREYDGTPVTSQKLRHQPRYHKMPKELTRILGARKWNSPTPENSLKGI